MFCLRCGAKTTKAIECPYCQSYYCEQCVDSMTYYDYRTKETLTSSIPAWTCVGCGKEVESE